MKNVLHGKKGLCAAVFLGTLGSGGALALSAQQTPPPRGQQDGGRGGPTPAMLKACVAKKPTASCSAPGADGNAFAGICRAPEGLPLACVPEGDGPQSGPGGGGPGGGGPGGSGPGPNQSNTGAMLESTQASTLGVLCGLAGNAPNSQIGLLSQFQWSCAKGQRTLTANGVPNHSVGQFPNPANPNAISVHAVSYAVTTAPVAYSGPGGRVKEPVMALNGIKFDPGTGGSCKDGITSPTQCPLGPGSGGQWNIEALGQNSFDFGVDANHAHVQPGGTYHYHGVPEGMLSPDAKAGRQMALIGWAVDGFPVYARYGYATPNVPIGALKLVRPSYRLKHAPDSGRPAVSIVPMGAFMQDWEYVAGLGDLDECNGRFGSTPEFPAGIYHYFATDAYPYIQRCVKGSVENAPQRRVERPRVGRGQGGPGEGGRRPGGPGQGGRERRQ